MAVIWETIAAFIGTAAFSVLFHVPKKQWAICGLVGGIGWIVYALTHTALSITAASFSATLVIVLLARILAVLRKVPSNVFMLSGIFPIVPGVGIYDTIYNLMIGDAQFGLIRGLETLKAVGAIVLGIVVIFAIPNKVFTITLSKKSSETM